MTKKEEIAESALSSASDLHAFYDDPDVLGERVYDVPVEAVFPSGRVLKSERDLIDEIEDPQSQVSVFAAGRQSAGHVVAAFRRSPHQVGAYIWEHKVEVGSVAVVFTVAAVAGVVFLKKQEEG